MTQKFIGRAPNPTEQWNPGALLPPTLLRPSYPSLGFVRLAMLHDMSPALTEAYETRVRPGNPDHVTLFEQLYTLSAADLGRFCALEDANTVRFIVSKAVSDQQDKPRLTVLAIPGNMYSRAPLSECCDAYGQPLNVLYPSTAAFKQARSYAGEIDQVIKTALATPSSEAAERYDAFYGAWGEAGRELIAAARIAHRADAQAGPNLALQTPFEPSYEQPPQTP